MRILKYKNRTHLLAIDFGLFALFILVTIVSPPTNTGEAQTVNVVKVPQKVIETVIKYDSTDALIKVKLDSLALNTEKLKSSTELVEKTTLVMKKQNVELRKHTKLIDQIENKLKYDSISTADKNKVDLVKKKEEVCVETNINSLPEIKAVEPERKGILNKIFHWRRK